MFVNVPRSLGGHCCDIDPRSSQPNQALGFPGPGTLIASQGAPFTRSFSSTTPVRGNTVRTKLIRGLGTVFVIPLLSFALGAVKPACAQPTKIGRTANSTHDSTKLALSKFSSGTGLSRAPVSKRPISAAAPAASSLQYRVFAWNDLGMHCYDSDYSVFSILPPFNTVHAQVVQIGSTPLLCGSN
jgi:hypothetical protein